MFMVSFQGKKWMDLFNDFVWQSKNLRFIFVEYFNASQVALKVRFYFRQFELENGMETTLIGSDLVAIFFEPPEYTFE